MTGPVLSRLLAPAPLAAADVRAAFASLLDPKGTDVARAAVLVALAARPVSDRELALFAGEMRRRARPFPIPRGDRPVDLCGSGGARVPSFNVSTLGALVVAAAGAPVVKHGNRSAAGICGSSDLLEALGLPVVRSREFSRVSYRRHRIAFLHAPLYHPATAAVGPVRRLLEIPTIFNRLGPLTNPALVPLQVVGAPDVPTAEIFSRVLARLGVGRGMAMTSADGCDEFSPRAPTTAIVWRGRKFRRRTFVPEHWLDAEDRRGPWGPLAPAAAAAEAERILAGGGGARRGAALLTAGAALWTVGATPTFARGLARAGEALDDGRAARLLGDLKALGSRYRAEAG
ncbi:MAG: anthranilate phosphoribosyltransferase [Thermoplasmata archaeon]